MVEPESPPDADLYSNKPHEFDENDDESLQAARADLELLQAAYPDEIQTDPSTTSSSRFPLTARLHFSPTALCQLQWRHGYPATSRVEIISWRARDAREQHGLEQARQAWRNTAAHNNSGLLCCAAALEAWNHHRSSTTAAAVAAAAAANAAVEEETTAFHRDEDSSSNNNKDVTPKPPPSFDSGDCYYHWTSGEPLVDRKSIFQAHLCRLHKEADVAPALHQLLTSSSKLQRATHHMYAYRIAEELPPQQQQSCTDQKKRSNHPLDTPSTQTTTTVLKHDNSDDGEDGAGSRLAHLLQMRHDQNVLVVVSRWYGGIPLGPKRFAHIANAARNLLVVAQQEQQQEQARSSSSNNNSSRVHSKGNGKK